MILGQIRSIRFACLGVALAATLIASQSPSAASGVGYTEISGTHRYVVSLSGLASTDGSTAGVSGSVAARGDVERVARVDRAVGGLAARLGFHPRFQYHWALQGFAADLDAAQVAALRADPRVAAISADVPVQLSDQIIPTGVERVQAQPISSGGPAVPDLTPVNVAEIDTGIRHLIPENELHIGGGIDCADDDKKGQTDAQAWKDADPGGHGTHVAGIIGAVDNGQGVVGVAPGVKLWSVRVFDSHLQGSSATVICGLDWVAQTRSLTPPAGSQPIDVANLSLRGPREPMGPEACQVDPKDDPDAEHVAVCAAFHAGVTLVVAAGNEATDTRDVAPAGYDQVITVSALSDFDGAPGDASSESCPGPRGHETDDTFARYSNFGADVDLIAPGSCIVSLNKSGTGVGVRVLSGTSMAAPHVSGAAARYIADVLAHGGGRPTPSEVRSALRAAAGFNWSAATDPDGTPDRLLNVAGLTAAPGVRLSALPSRVRVPLGAGPTDRTVQLELTRLGLFTGTVTLGAAAGAPITAWVTNPTLSGLDDAGISTTLHISVPGSVADGDYPVTVSASSPPLSIGDAIVTVHVDRHRPTVGTFAAAIVAGKSLRQRVAVRLAWHGQDAGGTIAQYELQQQIGTRPWESVGLRSTTSESIHRLMEPRTDYAFRARAIDDTGNVGEWTVLYERIGIRESNTPAIRYSVGWTTRLRSSASGGSLEASRTAGARADVTFYGTGVAWVAPVGPGKGTATVVLDGTGPGITVNLHAATVGTRRIVFASAALVPGTHTFRVTVKNGVVDVDAILILG